MIEDCKLGLFHFTSFAGDLRDSKPTSSGVLCVVGSQTFVPIFLDVQEANSCVSHQCRKIRNNVFGLGFEDGRYPALHLWDSVSETFTRSDAEGNITRPSGKCHSLAHSADHLIFEMVHRAPVQHSRELIPSPDIHA